MGNCLICHMSNRQKIRTFVATLFWFSLSFRFSNRFQWVFTKESWFKFWMISFISFTNVPSLFLQTKLNSFLAVFHCSYFESLLFVRTNSSYLDFASINLQLYWLINFLVILTWKTWFFLLLKCWFFNNSWLFFLLDSFSSFWKISFGQFF